MQLFTSSMFFYAFLGGFLPALVWLWFWLREDKKNPEPKRIILKTFIAGAAAVFMSFLIDKGLISYVLRDPSLNEKIQNIDVIIDMSRAAIMSISAYLPYFMLLASVEELTKYFAAYITAFHKRDYDEPIDAMIYMITAAIGFAAMENSLFLLKALADPGADSAYFMLTGNLRFLGSTLLHIVSSAVVGGMIGLSFYGSRTKKFIYVLSGLVMATILHALFNFFIIVNEGSNIFKVLLILWLVAILIIIFFEKIKTKKKYA